MGSQAGNLCSAKLHLLPGAPWLCHHHVGGLGGSLAWWADPESLPVDIPAGLGSKVGRTNTGVYGRGVAGGGVGREGAIGQAPREFWLECRGNIHTMGTQDREHTWRDLLGHRGLANA